jgi:hypothetical protein
LYRYQRLLDKYANDRLSTDERYESLELRIEADRFTLRKVHAAQPRSIAL